MRVNQCGSSPLSPPPVWAPSSTVLSEALQGWWQQWEGCWSKCKCCKDTRRLSLCWQGEPWRTWSAGWSNFGAEDPLTLLSQSILVINWMQNILHVKQCWSTVEEALQKYSCFVYMCHCMNNCTESRERYWKHMERNIQEKFEISGLSGEGCYN